MFLVFMMALLIGACEKSPLLPATLPNFEKAKFSKPTTITNPYYGPADGKKYTYVEFEVGKAPNKKIVIQRRTVTKKIYGIDCIIHQDVVSENGIVIEDTDDWLAQDDDGNLWYMGEFVNNFDSLGKFEDNDGSWEADVEEAEPGYWMPAKPTVGLKYHQEFWQNEAEDEAEVVEVGRTVNIPMGTFKDCIVTKDFTRIEPQFYELKFYAPGIGFIKEEKYENNVLIEELYLDKIE